MKLLKLVENEVFKMVAKKRLLIVFAILLVLKLPLGLGLSS